MDWQKKEIGPELVNEIKRKYGCDPLTSAILVRRGIIEGKDILFYLEDDMRYLHSPFLFKNMEDAVDRILDAREEKEKVNSIVEPYAQKMPVRLYNSILFSYIFFIPYFSPIMQDRRTLHDVISISSGL